MGRTGEAGGVLFEGFLDGSYDCVDRVQANSGVRSGRRRWS